ncbi:MAG: NAD(P)/FAD-dependent oxidoreductase [Desulfobulbales bacterium]
MHKKTIDDLYDVIIVGGGVAGLAGAITAGQMDLRALLLEKTVFGGSVAVLETINEYPGVEKIGGWELTQTMVKQARNSGCLLFDSIEVTGLQAEDDSRFEVQCHGGDIFRAGSVIVFTGGQPKLLGLKDEARFAQKGIHTCAQCAGARYKGREVVIAGTGRFTVRAALHLLELGCRVFFITGEAKIFGDASLIKKILSHKQFHFMGGSHVTKLSGDKYLQEIEVADLVSGDLEKLAVAAVFVYRGIVPESSFLAAQKDAQGFLLVDDNVMTSLPGVFAAGRVVHEDLPIQVLIGDGSRAALSAAAWLQSDAG